MRLLSTEEKERQFTELYLRYNRDVYHFLLCFTGGRTEAEDLTQEVFMRLVSALSTFEGRSERKTWILGIAKNTAREWYRKQRLRHFVTEHVLRGMHTKDGLPDRELEEKESRGELLASLQRLKPHHRMVVILRVLKECSVRETAEIMGCSEAKVKVDYQPGGVDSGSCPEVAGNTGSIAFLF